MVMNKRTTATTTPRAQSQRIAQEETEACASIGTSETSFMSIRHSEIATEICDIRAAAQDVDWVYTGIAMGGWDHETSHTEHGDEVV